MAKLKADASSKKQGYFSEQLELTRKAATALEYTYQRTKKRIPSLLQVPKIQLDDEQAELLEALTGRFARVADLIVQRLFRALDALELVDEGSILDRLHRAEKRGLIQSAETWAEIRELRNQIAHEYVVSDLSSLYQSVFQNVPLLFSALEGLDDYYRKKWP